MSGFNITEERSEEEEEKDRTTTCPYPERGIPPLILFLTILLLFSRSSSEGIIFGFVFVGH